MKKFTLSVVTVLAMSTFAVAGGDIEPVIEPVVEVEAPAADDSSFYIGAGYSYVDIEMDDFPVTEANSNAFMLLAGYNFNKYIAVEGRYTKSLGDMEVTWIEGGDTEDIDADVKNIAIYLKPMYPVGKMTLYGLLGYGRTTLDFTGDGGPEGDDSGFQWGIGASYAMNDNIGLFVDYTRLYDDTGFDDLTSADVTVDSINFGVTYTF